MPLRTNPAIEALFLLWLALALEVSAVRSVRADWPQFRGAGGLGNSKKPDKEQEYREEAKRLRQHAGSDVWVHGQQVKKGGWRSLVVEQ